MKREVLKKIMQGARVHDNYFLCKPDCTGMVGFTSYQKCTVALRCFAYGAPPDAQDDDYFRMAKSTAFVCVYKF